jgi:hypothetical protein
VRPQRAKGPPRGSKGPRNRPPQANLSAGMSHCAIGGLESEVLPAIGALISVALRQPQTIRGISERPHDALTKTFLPFRRYVVSHDPLKRLVVVKHRRR